MSGLSPQRTRFWRRYSGGLFPGVRAGDPQIERLIYDVLDRYGSVWPAERTPKLFDCSPRFCPFALRGAGKEWRDRPLDHLRSRSHDHQRRDDPWAAAKGGGQKRDDNQHRRGRILGEAMREAFRHRKIRRIRRPGGGQHAGGSLLGARYGGWNRGGVYAQSLFERNLRPKN